MFGQGLKGCQEKEKNVREENLKDKGGLICQAEDEEENIEERLVVNFQKSRRREVIFDGETA